MAVSTPRFVSRLVVSSEAVSRRAVDQLGDGDGGRLGRQAGRVIAQAVLEQLGVPADGPARPRSSAAWRADTVRPSRSARRPNWQWSPAQSACASPLDAIGGC
jgi:hypothetical protein